jgi:uncharacterized protein
MRVVLDTNVVVSALLFSKGRLSWMRHAWQSCRLQPVVCKESVSELLWVLNYPKFSLNIDDQKNLLADFLPYADIVTLPNPWPELPLCRDGHDQLFLVLTHVAQSATLITGDADILTLQHELPFATLTPDELAEKISARS